LPLASGPNDFIVRVENGGQQREYTLAITRRSGSTFAEKSFLKAGVPDADDVFGTEVAVSGDLVAVGIPFEDSAARGINGDEADDAAPNSGAVIVFAKTTGGGFTKAGYLKASNADVNDNFGTSVALSGNVLAVGAPQEASAATGIGGNQADNSAFAAGAVYIFERDVNGLWTQQAYIKADNAAASAGFGRTVALHGNVLAVGAPNAPLLQGSVYVFVRAASGAWSQQAVIQPSDAAADHGFANELALEGSTLIVGAPFHGGITSFRGAVYTFQRDATGSWVQEPLLRGSNTGSNDNFGSSVALSGSTLVVGAVGEASRATGIDGNQNDNGASNSGAAYAFERVAGAWQQRAYIKASNTESGDGFGYAVSLSNNWLVVTAPHEDSAAIGVGGAQVDNGKPDSGAVYLFSRSSSGTWAQELYIKSGNSDSNDRFGRAAAFSPSALIVAAPFEDSHTFANPASNSAQASGAAYVFE
jgi:hypothetical protein